MKLDGTHGRPGHRRQRYKCSPGAGGKPHVFTELLPREESWQSSCEHCERALERREGPMAPRHCQFVAWGIAEALQALGAGDSYMHAARVIRDRARRFRLDLSTGELRESDHGQLLADWVEVFAPVVFEAHRPTTWPVEGSLLLDHLPFRVRALDAHGRRIPTGRTAFDVFCAVGFSAGRPRLWPAQAFASARPVVAALYPRRYGLKNRERLNRLLMLLQLHINGDDDVQAYARVIRRHLELNPDFRR